MEDRVRPLTFCGAISLSVCRLICEATTEPQTHSDRESFHLRPDAPKWTDFGLNRGAPPALAHGSRAATSTEVDVLLHHVVHGNRLAALVDLNLGRLLSGDRTVGASTRKDLVVVQHEPMSRWLQNSRRLIPEERRRLEGVALASISALASNRAGARPLLADANAVRHVDWARIALFIAGPGTSEPTVSIADMVRDVVPLAGEPISNDLIVEQITQRYGKHAPSQDQIVKTIGRLRQQGELAKTHLGERLYGHQKATSALARARRLGSGT